MARIAGDPQLAWPTGNIFLNFFALCFLVLKPQSHRYDSALWRVPRGTGAREGFSWVALLWHAVAPRLFWAPVVQWSFQVCNVTVQGTILYSVRTAKVTVFDVTGVDELKVFIVVHFVQYLPSGFSAYFSNLRGPGTVYRSTRKDTVIVLEGHHTATHNCLSYTNVNLYCTTVLYSPRNLQQHPLFCPSAIFVGTGL